jgi:hypothetical protein
MAFRRLRLAHAALGGSPFDFAQGSWATLNLFAAQESRG